MGEPSRFAGFGGASLKAMLERWGPRLVAHLNVAFDLTVVMCVTAAAAWLSGRTVDPRVLACAGCLALFWSALISGDVLSNGDVIFLI